MTCSVEAADKETFSRLLKRAAWRIQYKIKTVKNKEIEMEDSIPLGITQNFEDEVISRIFIEELLSSIPNLRNRCIIRKIILEGYTEKEVASDLNISQQAVNKCKRKAIKDMKERICHLIDS
ncbi:hypothetical protein [Cytobacillus oceanisediminis]|uniref:RNA polymerase sigma factor (Sigma-70 family) n=1 Tax=Cytobacillus oceanisediminis TaxID=665099 RepID=A0ABX3CMP5_9BACI|nr:hypothetical protein [Cytobacillus oceanisediminis]OHX44768.1 hypothetical protein BBV17_25015 [Cytobacillus oceanisediminis]